MPGLARGFLGALVSGMLSSNLALADMKGGFGDSRIGPFEIIIIASTAYILYVMVQRNSQAKKSHQHPLSHEREHETKYAMHRTSASSEFDSPAQRIDRGLAQIRQLNPSFDMEHFNNTATNIFLKVQAARVNMDFSAMSNILTDNMVSILKGSINKYIHNKQIDPLENITVTQVEPIEIWQERGKDFITVRFYTNILDYTKNKRTGAVVSNNTEPTKFKEYWTFTRPIGHNPWKVSAITQS